MNKIKVRKLKNGLRYILIPVEGISSATVLTLVSAGTKYETPENNGISHFLEHMVFKGTKKYPSASIISREIDGIGGIINAFTGKEYTGFYVKSAVSHIDLAFSVVSQLVNSPLIPEKELEVERGVILEEIRMYEDQPQIKVGDVFENVLFGDYPLGWDTLGKAKIIRELKRQDFKNYMRYLYSPNRMVLVVAGGIGEVKNIDKMIGKYFREERNEVKIEANEVSFEQSQAKQKQVIKKTEQSHLVFGYRGLARGDKDRYNLAVLSTILGNGMSSRLFEEIREKRGLAYYVSSVLESYMEGGYIGFRAGTNPNTAKEVLKIGRAQFEKIKEKKVSSEELKKAKEFMKGHLLLSLENSYAVASFYGDDLLMEGKIREINNVISAIDKVTASGVMNVAKKLFVDSKSNLAMIGPKEIKV